MTPRNDVAAALADAARSMNHRISLDETLQRIAEVTRDSVPGFDEVGISILHKKGKIETRAATGELVPILDKIQYGLDEGPCVDSLHTAGVVSPPGFGTTNGGLATSRRPSSMACSRSWRSSSTSTTRAPSVA
jgi:hypothetical protein